MRFVCTYIYTYVYVDPDPTLHKQMFLILATWTTAHEDYRHRLERYDYPAWSLAEIGAALAPIMPSARFENVCPHERSNERDVVWDGFEMFEPSCEMPLDLQNLHGYIWVYRWVDSIGCPSRRCRASCD